MTESSKPRIGTVAWFDLTVPEAGAIRDFYAAVVGWQFEPVDMGGYADFVMKSPATGTAAAGVCHTRGENADLPAQWLSYVIVADLDASREQCVANGGELITPIKGNAGEGRYSVIRDPAGAYLALMERAAG